MSAGQRPGGLTALAVLNFVWGGMLAIAMLGAMAGGAAMTHAANSGEPIVVTTTNSATGAVETKTLDKADVKKVSSVMWIVTLVMGVSAALLIASGVGYLGMKRFLGRTLGNVYAVLSLAGCALGVANGGFDFGTVIMLVYPLLTLVLINTTFKPDLVN